MVNNETYDKLVENLERTIEKTISEFQDAFKKDKNEDVERMNNLIEYIKDLEKEPF